MADMRLIDVNALLVKLSRMIDYCQTDKKVNGLTALFQVGDAIMDCPTIDAVPVVRCKDCKMYEENPEAFTTLCRRELHYLYARPDGYCSYGERKDDGLH